MFTATSEMKIIQSIASFYSRIILLAVDKL